jgi:hypothetical protein
MQGTAAVLPDGLKVFLRPIPLVLGKIILRVLIMVGHHQSIPSNLSHDGGCGYRDASLVAFGDGLLGKREA